MKIRNPYDRNDLKINKKDRVLEIGPGHNPSFRSNVLAEKFVDTNYHRCGDVKIYLHQTFVNADGENLPFVDKEFDYTICCHVLEHAEDPVKFVRELSRVSPKGYIETPSLIGEYLFPKKSHKWVILEIDGKLVFYEKAKMTENYACDYGEMFLNYLPFQSLAYRLLWYTRGNMMNICYEWKNDIEIIVNPQDEYYLSFFIEKWDRQMSEKIFPSRTILKDLWHSLKAASYVLSLTLKDKLKNRRPLELSEYMKRKGTNDF
ncbi:MAG: class I SAM-dependent methyltransferase [Mangrovibacterium sp.]